MTLKYQVESLEGIDETAQAFYKEAEGGKGYVLQVAGVVPESKFNEVNQKAVDAQEEARRRRATVERVTGKLGLETADGLDDALEALINKKPNGKPDADQEAVIQQIKDAAKAREAELSGEVKKLKMGGAKDALKAAVLGANFHPEIADDITQTALGRVQLDDDGNLRIMSSNGGPLAGSGADGFATFADLANELAAAKPSFLVDGGKGGGGKPPASGGSGGGSSNPLSSIPGFSQLPTK